MKILVIRFSSIGDIVLTTPVVRAIRQQTGAQVHYLTKKHYAGILSENPYIDKLHLLEPDDSNFKQLVADIKAEGYDHIVDLHKNLRTLKLRYYLPMARYHSFDKLTLERFLFVRFKRPMPQIHIVDRYLQAVRPLGVVADKGGLDYFIPPKDEVELDWLPEPFREKYVAYVIGGQHATKKLPFERMVQLCDQIQHPIVLLGGPEDAAEGERLAAFFNREQGDPSYAEGLRQLGKDKLVFNACGKFNLNQSASLIRQSYAVFSHDTGLMHVAAAFKKQVFAIFGSTSSKLGFYPYRTKFVLFENNRLSCRPCSTQGLAACPKGHFKCMRELEFDFWLP